MERLLKFYLKCIVLLFLISCNSKKEKIDAAIKFGKHASYQGNPVCMNAFASILEIDSTNAEAYRELSIPYLKRGIPHQWKKWIDKAVTYDSVMWQPYRGYNYLWFYRDYEKAIADFDASDTLTPYLDQPQGHSVDYWRGIAYLGLNDYENSITYWNKHIQKETEEAGEDWVELEAFLYRGIAHYESGNLDDAKIDFNKILTYFKNSADTNYYLAKIAKALDEKELGLKYIANSIKDFENGYYNQRPYVETLRQIYLGDIHELKLELEDLN